MGNLGLGVMLGMLSGNASTVEAVRSSVGKTIESASLVENVLRIKLGDGSTLSLRDDGQSCCEARYMRTDDDLAYYAGSTLLDFELADAPSVKAEYEEHDVQFLHVKTSKGSFTMSNHVEHNGYYGGFLIVASVEAP